MTRPSTYDRAAREAEELGELLDRHRSDDAADLEQFEPYRDAVAFAEEVLDQDLTSDQREALELLASEDRVAWQAAQAVGKSRCIAIAALWWAYCRQGQVLISAPTARTVQEVIMRKELARLWRPRPELKGDLYTNSLRIRGDEPAILAYTATSAAGATGQHDPEGGVLAILDEAQGVPPEVWVAMDANTTGTRDRQFVCGNPTDPTGDFFEVCQSGSGWATIRSSALDHPNLDPDADQWIPGGPSDAWLMRMRDRWGEDSRQWTARVLGQFPSESEDALVTGSQVEAAFTRHDAGWGKRWERDEPLVCGLDVARKGSDKTVLCIRQGRRVREFRSWSKTKTMKTVGRVIDALNGLEDGLNVTVAVDLPGVGAGVSDRLAEVRRENPRVAAIIGKVVEFDGRKRARQSARFKNARAEAYWYLREQLEEGELALPRRPELREELTSMRWTVTSQGKVKIEPKDDLKARIGRSPDLADSVAISLCEKARHSGEAALVPM